MDFGQVAEKQINRGVPRPVRVVAADFKHPVIHRQPLSRRDDVNVVFLDRHRFGDLQDWHPGRFLDDLVRDALVIGRQVKNDHERHAVVMRHVLEKQFDGLQPARRRSNAYHWKIQGAGLQGLTLRSRGRVLGGAGHFFCLSRRLRSIDIFGYKKRVNKAA